MEPGEQKKFKSGTEDSEDESEILEESPCGRWLKRREEVQQRDVPGIDAAYLAMDTEEGVEVVWNEVRFSERKKFKAQEDKIRQVFDNLIQLEHPNIVKFHKYWIDSRDDKPRVIFITEYMSSGSLKQFLKRTKRNVKKPPLQAWKRWCTQILSALSFLHSCSPPIVHGNLTCDTIFIQHNGLIKIGSVAPDAIHQHVKTCREGMRNTHFWAPEFGAVMTPAADIYSFGVCALEMAALEIQGNGDSSALVTEDQVQRTIEGLEVAVQKDFIRACLKAESTLRPTARGLLFHPALFEVSPLKLLAAHTVVNRCSVNMETITDEVLQRHYGPGIVVAEIRYASPQVAPVQFCMSDVAPTEKLEKFVEDVKYGIYPLTVFAPVPAADHAHHAHHAHHSSHHGHHSHGHHGGHGGHGGTRTASPDAGAVSAHGHGHHGAGRSETPEPLDVETRRVANMMCDVKPKDDAQSFQMTLLLRMDDRMNRQLSCTVVAKDDAMALAEELVHYGFINEVDRQQVGSLMSTALHSCMARNRMGAAAQLPPAAAAAAAAAASPAASPAAASAASSPHLFDGDGDAEAAGVASPVATPSLSPVAVSS